MTTKTYTLDEIEKLKEEGKSDLKRLEKMTEKELEEAAKSDPDSAWPTEEELKKFKRPNKEFFERFKK